MVVVGRYELVHISTDTTTTSRLPKGRPHIMKCIFFLIDYTGLMGELKAFALAERGMLRRYTQGVAVLCPGLIGVSLSGYNFLLDFEKSNGKSEQK